MTSFLPSLPPLIELRVWRQFVVLADTLHFGRAAQQLHMTQPPLTQSIAQLEANLGVRLFDRTQRSVRLSAAGAALLPEVTRLLAQAAVLPAHAQASAQGQAGRLRLAFVSTLGFDVLPRWVRAFRQRFARVTLELTEATSDIQLQALERGEIDAGVVLQAPDFVSATRPNLNTFSIAQEKLVLALPEHSDFARHAGNLRPSQETLTALLQQPLVIFPRRIAPSLHEAIFSIYQRAGLQPDVAQEAIQMQTIVNLVSAGLGLAWVPASVRQFQRSGVVYRAVSLPTAAAKRDTGFGATIPRCETCLIWPADNRNPVAENFVAFVRTLKPKPLLA